ncbi:hypothetical protein K8354_04410 [Polaribacter litorisediminis]|uniref:DUF6090 family protein n=1 Tax=Polaribacter litorisediminis TaxID=1908341 RepID=UPI001CBF6C71|nr:DUF6090 family protein [Polaribacter litorisediminis]UAM99073.1 hypothetical protein K8354_04410 [Polaribacter litorisediminis]
MEKNKTGKPAFAAGRYFKYAIGEIILVVIGILIAIQLNEWRNDSVNAKQKQQVLETLKTDFEVSLTRLDTVYYNQEQSLWKFRKSRDLIDSINYVTDNTVLKENLAHGGHGHSFNPINGALRSAISSGDIHLIKNKRLIELLFSWEDLVVDSYEEIEMLRKYSMETYQPLIQKYTQVTEIYKNIMRRNGSHHPSDFVGLFKDPQFENFTQVIIFKSYNYREELKGIRTNNLEIIKLIEQELKK